MTRRCIYGDKLHFKRAAVVPSITPSQLDRKLIFPSKQIDILAFLLILRIYLGKTSVSHRPCTNRLVQKDLNFEIRSYAENKFNTLLLMTVLLVAKRVGYKLQRT
jgi:hypothetical protein